MTTVGSGKAPARARGSPVKRVLLAAAIVVVTINVWTGSPLVALWVGSQVQAGGPPSMLAIFVFVAVFALLSFLLYRLLRVLSAAYDAATGQTRTVRRQTSWLRAMSGERERYEGTEPRLSAVERILAGMVIVVFVLFEVWLIFYSGSPFGFGDPTRGAVPPELFAALSPLR